MAEVKIPNTYDLQTIAIAAGSTDKSKWLYQNGTFYVGDVTQEQLEAAVAKYDDDLAKLDQLKTAAKRRIDQEAGQIRQRYITDVIGQELTYMEKVRDAEKFVQDGYPESSIDNYPWIKAEVNATGSITGQQAADEILAKRDEWTQIGCQIEQVRRHGKIVVDQQLGPAGVRAAEEQTINSLRLL